MQPEKWEKGEMVRMAYPLGERGSLTWWGTCIDKACGLVLVWTQDGQTHLFEEPSGELAHSKYLQKGWVLRP